jgi:ATP-binding cassette subfamily C protein
MGQVARIFLHTRGGTPYLLTACFLLASFAQSIGLASMLPLLSMVTGVGSESPLQSYLQNAYAAVGLPLTVGSLLAVIVGGLVVKEMLTLLAQRYVGASIASVATLLRFDLIRALLDARWQYLLGQRLGALSNAAGRQASTCGEAFRAAVQFVALTLQTIVLVGTAMLVSWKLSLAAIAFGVAAAVCFRRLIRQARNLGRKETQYSREFVSFLNDTMANMKPLKSSARTAAFIGMFEPKIQAIRKSVRGQAITKETLKSAQEIFTTIFLGIAFYVTLNYLDVSVSDIIVVGIFMSASVKNLNKLYGQYQLVVMLEPTYDEFHRRLDKLRAQVEPNPGTRPATFERGCTMEDVAFSYDERQTLNDVSLTIPVRDITVFVGPSGSGKTTLVDLMLGLYQPTRGRILLDDVLLSDIELESWRRMIGYVPQEPILFHDTLLNNLTFGDPSVDRQRVEAALSLAGATDFIAEMPDGLDTVVGERGARLSGGQRQRIALARALVTRPRLLILDEVTSALDPETERDVCASLRTLHRKDEALTIVAITHRPAFLDIADRIYRVDGGRVTLASPEVVA